MGQGKTGREDRDFLWGTSASKKATTALAVVAVVYFKPCKK